MRLDSLVRLIQSADFMSFRAIAMKCLVLRGYVQPSLSDGWKDGGTDVRIYQLPPNPTPIAFQVSVQREWKSKLREDAEKVRNSLALSNMFLVSSRRIPEAEFLVAAESVWQDYEVRVSRIDCQSIASTFFEREETSTVLELLGIEVPPPGAGAAVPDFRADAAYSFVFFGKETQRFRQAMIESTIITVASSAHAGVPRTHLESQVAESLQLSESQARLVSSGVDRMLQLGKLSCRDGMFLLEPKLVDAAWAMRALRDQQWTDLRTAVRSSLEATFPPPGPDSETVDSVLEDIGALILDTARMTSRSLDRREPRWEVMDASLDRLRHLHATLDAAGFGEGQVRDRFLVRLTDLASQSPIAQHLVAGEMFLSLTSVRTPHLVKALGTGERLEVILDASVAMPMLCGLLYEPTSQRYFGATHHMYQLLTRHGIGMVLPSDYLEEVASHLISAYRYYEPVIDADSDLAASDNAFVAHYVSLHADGRTGDFHSYLDGFQYDVALRRSEAAMARRSLMSRLRGVFAKYSIQTRHLTAREQNFKQAEMDLAHVMHGANIERPYVILRHDSSTIAHILETEEDAGTPYILCTWDGLLFRFAEDADLATDFMDPSVLADILSLASTDAQDMRISSPTFLARCVSEEASEGGANVWKELVRLEEGRLHDAQLINEAKAFKRAFLQSQEQGLGSADVPQAWIEWKQKHFEKPA